MSQAHSVGFATFCHAGDAHRLYAPGQLKKQVESNGYQFDEIIVIYQRFNSQDLAAFSDCKFPISIYQLFDFDKILCLFEIDLDKSQYTSHTDQAHQWQYHVVNHLKAAFESVSDYIVFADNDCWMVDQPEGKSWVERGIEILQSRPEVFIVSPNDGEPRRMTKRFSQQMFLARVKEFRYADFNQPGWDGNVNIPGGPMPEYWAMLEGRMELHCRVAGRYRYVLGPEYRYWHHNKLTKDNLFETDLSKY
jgi:hypothetical protein